MRLDKVLLDLAAEQRSCVGIWQARELGVSRTEASRLRRSALWDPIGNDVLVVSGAVRDRLCEASAAVLSAGRGAVLSDEPAAALWGVPGFRLLPVEVGQTANNARRRYALGRIHDRLLIPERWVTRYRGIRVVRPELAMY